MTSGGLVGRKFIEQALLALGRGSKRTVLPALSDRFQGLQTLVGAGCILLPVVYAAGSHFGLCGLLFDRGHEASIELTGDGQSLRIRGQLASNGAAFERLGPVVVEGSQHTMGSLVLLASLSELSCGVVALSQCTFDQQTQEFFVHASPGERRAPRASLTPSVGWMSASSACRLPEKSAPSCMSCCSRALIRGMRAMAVSVWGSLP